MAELKQVGTLKSGQPVFDRPDSHLHESVGEIIEEVLAKVETDAAFHREIVDMGRVVGQSTCVETTPYDWIVYAQRPDRQGPTRFVKQREPQDCKSVVVALKKGPGGYLLLSAYIGWHDHLEPWHKKATDEDAEFWTNHALVWGSEEVVPGTEGRWVELRSYQQLLNYKQADDSLRNLFREFHELLGVDKALSIAASLPKLSVPVLAEMVDGRLEARGSYRIETKVEVTWMDKGWQTMLKLALKQEFVQIDGYGHVFSNSMSRLAEGSFYNSKSQYDYPEGRQRAKKLVPLAKAIRHYGRRKVFPGHALDFQTVYRQLRDSGLPRGVTKRKALALRAAANSRCFAWRCYLADKAQLDEYQARLELIEQRVVQKSMQVGADKAELARKLEELREQYPNLVEKKLGE